ncbi:hypothetical protein RIF29_18524 [Crotalaria pallida]|uniref:Wax synthase domain-containing protein n=1 Tax=Crotalaria pallida TaxID=3830 RepID=A0AAN9IDZ6_CROPI
MEGEISNYIKVWFHVIISLCYCYGIGKIVPKGFFRLLNIIPIMCVFLRLPLVLHTIHLCGTFAFFISWLANFKLTLFAFGKGPLSEPSLSLKQFVVLASFPNNPNLPPKLENSPLEKVHKSHKSLLNSSIKGVVFILVIRAYDYMMNNNMHPVVLNSLYSLHLYLFLEVTLGIVALLAKTMLEVELEPHFNEPYLASSLQDFWGRRWNLVVVNTLRLSIYEPTKKFALGFIRPKCASLSAMLLTFLVSGLLHELLFYYLCRTRPTWEITCFFLLHGFFLLLEVSLKKKLAARFQLPRIVSAPLTLGFFMVTAFWLFFPQLLRCNVEQRAFQEYAQLSMFVKNAAQTFMLWLNNA